jgi:hypothetical protein
MKRPLIFLTLAILLTFALLFAGCSNNATQEPLNPDPVENGEGDEEEIPVVLKKIPPVMAIIDNHPSARPPSGLQQATLVYEFLVEGGLTRYLAVFDTLPQESFVIGPIRSLRPYFAHQAADHGGVVAHGGYSKRTGELIRGISLKHITSATYLWRDSSRKAPHNLYSDMETLLKAAKHDGTFTEVTPQAPTLPTDFEEGATVEVTYSNSNKVSYTYDQSIGAYQRFINGKPHTDRVTGLQYNARRVIIRKTPHTNVPDSKLVDIALTGEGQGLLFEAGQQHKIKWQYKDGMTHYYYADNSPVDLTYGNTWVQVTR